jgi:hypothetical protein
MEASDWCQGGAVVVSTSFDCNAGLEGWVGDGGGFQVGKEPAPPSAWDDNCSLRVQALESTQLRSPPFDLAEPSTVRVRFMEWVSLLPETVGQARWVGVLSGDGLLGAMLVLPEDAATWKTWGPREVVLTAPAGVGARLVLGLDVGEPAPTSGWYLDRLVVLVSAADEF